MKLSLELSLEYISEAVSGTATETVAKKISTKLSLELSVELGVVHLVLVCTRHRALTVPDDAAAPPGKPSSLLPRCWNTPSRPREKLVAPSVSAQAQKRWNHRPWSLAMDSGLGSASGGASTSIGSSSRRSNGAEGTTPLRASSPPPVVVTDTICNPGASAAAPEFLPSTRPLG